MWISSVDMWIKKIPIHRLKPGRDGGISEFATKQSSASLTQKLYSNKLQRQLIYEQKQPRKETLV